MGINEFFAVVQRCFLGESMKEGKVELLKILLGMAFVDGDYSENEGRLVEFLIDSYGLTPEQEEEVRSQKSGKIDLYELAESISSPEDRRQAYESAFLVALMDGSQDPEESEMLERLREALDLDDGVCAEAEERAQVIYDRFSDRDEPDEI